MLEIAIYTELLDVHAHLLGLNDVSNNLRSLIKSEIEKLPDSFVRSPFAFYLLDS